MKRFHSWTYFILLCLLQIACKSSPKIKSDIINLDGIRFDTLFLYHQRSNCGEFGGDSYKISVYRQKPDKMLIGNLKFVRKICDDNGIREVPDSSYKETVELKEKEQELIQTCIAELLKNQLGFDESIGHAGHVNAVWRSDSSFTLYDYTMIKWTNFDELIKVFEKR